MMYRAFTLVFPFLLVQLYTFVQGTDNSYCYDPSYALLRTCAGACVGCTGTNDRIAIVIGCGSNPQNECFCNPDLFDLATSGLSKCASKSCTVGGWEGDYFSAVYVYTNYCQRAGFTVGGKAPATAAATTTVNPIATFATPTSASHSPGTLNNGGNGGVLSSSTSTGSSSRGGK
jgi:hypothetical protein